jgi:hypothetical protein
MPAPSPSPAVIRAAATVARDTGCVVETEDAARAAILAAWHDTLAAMALLTMAPPQENDK